MYTCVQIEGEREGEKESVEREEERERVRRERERERGKERQREIHFLSLPFRLLLVCGIMWILFSVFIRIITAVSIELFNPDFVIFWEPNIR